MYREILFFSGFSLIEFIKAKSIKFNETSSNRSAENEKTENQLNVGSNEQIEEIFLAFLFFSFVLLIIGIVLIIKSRHKRQNGFHSEQVTNTIKRVKIDSNKVEREVRLLLKVNDF